MAETARKGWGLEEKELPISNTRVSTRKKKIWETYLCKHQPCMPLWFGIQTATQVISQKGTQLSVLIAYQQTGTPKELQKARHRMWTSWKNLSHLFHPLANPHIKDPEKALTDLHRHKIPRQTCNGSFSPINNGFFFFGGGLFLLFGSNPKFAIVSVNCHPGIQRASSTLLCAKTDHQCF